MNRCENCKIYIMDDTDICPLCSTVLTEVSKQEISEKNEEQFIRKVQNGAPYPDVRSHHRHIYFLMRLVLFLFIVVEAGLIYLNVRYYQKVMWSGITGLGMLYFYLSLKYWIYHDSGHASKIGRQMFVTLFLVIGIDYFIGFSGWSLEIGVPCIALVGNALVYILMLANRSQWYSYILLLVFCGILDGMILVFHLIGWVDFVNLAVISFCINAVFLLGTFLFGERELKRELKRRFHV